MRDVTGRHDGQLNSTGAVFFPGGIAGNARELERAQDGFARMPPFLKTAIDRIERLP